MLSIIDIQSILAIRAAKTRFVFVLSIDYFLINPLIYEMSRPKAQFTATEENTCKQTKHKQTEKLAFFLTLNL